MGTFTTRSHPLLETAGQKGQWVESVGLHSWKVPESLTPTLAPRLPRTWNAGPAASTSKKKTSKTVSSPSAPLEMMKGGSQPPQMLAMPSLRRRCVVATPLSLPHLVIPLFPLWSPCISPPPPQGALAERQHTSMDLPKLASDDRPVSAQGRKRAGGLI